MLLSMYTLYAKMLKCFMLMLAINLANALAGYYVILCFSNENGTNGKF